MVVKHPLLSALLIALIVIAVATQFRYLPEAYHPAWLVTVTVIVTSGILAVFIARKFLQAFIGGTPGDGFIIGLVTLIILGLAADWTYSAYQSEFSSNGKSVAVFKQR